MLRLQGSICRASTEHHWLAGSQAAGRCDSHLEQTGISQAP